MLLCCLGSCVDEFNAQLPESESNLLVVEGNIISDSTCVFNLLDLSHSLALLTLLTYLL